MTLPAWSNISYPARATLASYSEGAGDGVTSSYSFEVVGVCADAISPAGVRSFYSSGLPAKGWVQSATFPYHGDPTSACGDPYCWKMPASGGTTLYLSLEDVHASGTATLFTLRSVAYSVNS